VSGVERGSVSPSLHRAVCGSTVLVTGVTGGWSMRQRLQQLGILEGCEVIVKRRALLGGPLLVSVQGLNVAVGRGLARHVRIKAIE
jgi:ferrous iron transport protein A